MIVKIKYPPIYYNETEKNNMTCKMIGFSRKTAENQNKLKWYKIEVNEHTFSQVVKSFSNTEYK